MPKSLIYLKVNGLNMIKNLPKSVQTLHVRHYVKTKLNLNHVIHFIIGKPEYGHYEFTHEIKYMNLHEMKSLRILDLRTIFVNILPFGQSIEHLILRHWRFDLVEIFPSIDKLEFYFNPHDGRFEVKDVLHIVQSIKVNQLTLYEQYVQDYEENTCSDEDSNDKIYRSIKKNVHIFEYLQYEMNTFLKGYLRNY